MIFTINELIHANVRVVSYYQNAVNRWETILAQEGARDPNTLASILTDAQTDFEEDCNLDRGIAKEIMAIAGIARLYDPGAGFSGHEGDVHLVRLAIARSCCSLEVKFTARDVAEYYHLPPLPELSA